MQEPSVLDYLKSLVAPWKYPRVHIPLPDEREEITSVHSAPVRIEEPTIPVAALEETDIEAVQEQTQSERWFWVILGALGIAILAQFSLEPTPNRTWIPGLILYLIAFAMVGVSYLRKNWQLPEYKREKFVIERPRLRILPFLAGIILAALTFLNSSGNQFTLTNLLLLLLASGFLIWSFWQTDGTGQTKFALSPWSILVLATIGVAMFFRYYRIGEVPPEMNSDHAEKIMDVLRVLDGQTMIFFPGNGGREPLQFYLVAGLHKFLNLDLNFTILKLVTITAGFLSLPFIYLMGRDLVNKRVGLIALALSAVAYWPNVVSRVGMRLPFYILFSAAVLYFLLRGLQTGRRNYFIMGGISLGLSLYGYSADRILPLVVIAGVLLYILHERSKPVRQQVILSTLILFIIAGVLFVPMVRFMLEDPDSFLLRTLSRMGSAERELPGPAWEIFLSNLGKATLMFSWDNGQIWPVSVPYRPALDVITASLFWVGTFVLLLRYIRRRHWLDLFLLVSIPVLMLPSILSLAFPGENPNLYRTGGAIVPVFTIIGITIDGFMKSIETHFEGLGTKLAWGFAILIISISATQSYNLVFREYYSQYRASAWNSSEMAEVVSEFAETHGGVDNVWVMAYPHWVDTRLVGIIAGFPTKNFVLFPEELNSLPASPGAKLFLIKPEDQTSIESLLSAYPMGSMEEYLSQTEGKNFLIYFVPPATSS